MQHQLQLVGPGAVAGLESGTEEGQSRTDSFHGVQRDAPPDLGTHIKWLMSATTPFMITQALQSLSAVSTVWQERAGDVDLAGPSTSPAPPGCQPMGPGPGRWLGQLLPVLTPVSSPLLLHEKDPGQRSSGAPCVHGNLLPEVAFRMQ